MSLEWKSCKIGDVVSVRRGASPRPIKDYVSETGVPWVKIADATSDQTRFLSSTKEFIKEEGVKSSVTVYPGDLIVSNSATPGLPKFMKIKACVHDGWLVFDNYDGILKEYLYYYFIVVRDRLVNQANGSVFKNLKTDIVRDFDIDLPPLETQEKIVSILSSIDEKIEKNIAINHNLEQFSQNLFKKWFIDFDLKNDFGICEDFKDSSLGEIPQSWEIRTVGELSDVKGRIGWRGYTTNDLVDDGPWVIGGKEITSGFIDFSSAKHLTREKYEESPEIMLKDKDLIIAKTGTIGPIAMFYEGFGEATLNPNVGLIRSKNISPALLLTFFKTPRAQYYLNEFTTSSVQPAINQTTIKQLEVALPSDISLLNKISLIFDEISDMQYNLIEEFKKLSILRDTLLPKLMSGEVDVSKINYDF